MTSSLEYSQSLREDIITYSKSVLYTILHALTNSQKCTNQNGLIKYKCCDFFTFKLHNVKCNPADFYYREKTSCKHTHSPHMHTVNSIMKHLKAKLFPFKITSPFGCSPEEVKFALTCYNTQGLAVNGLFVACVFVVDLLIVATQLFTCGSAFE